MLAAAGAPGGQGRGLLGAEDVTSTPSAPPWRRGAPGVTDLAARGDGAAYWRLERSAPDCQISAAQVGEKPSEAPHLELERVPKGTVKNPRRPDPNPTTLLPSKLRT